MLLCYLKMNSVGYMTCSVMNSHNSQIFAVFLQQRRIITAYSSIHPFYQLIEGKETGNAIAIACNVLSVHQCQKYSFFVVVVFKEKEKESFHFFFFVYINGSMSFILVGPEVVTCRLLSSIQYYLCYGVSVLFFSFSAVAVAHIVQLIIIIIIKLFFL